MAVWISCAYLRGMERSTKELSLAANGLLAILERDGSAKFAVLAADHDDFSMQVVENLVDCGFATVDETTVYFIEGDVTALKAEFDRFRKAYAGIKSGLDVEFDWFRKKNKKWRSIVPHLMPNYERQVAERAALKAVIDQKEKAFDKTHGLFLPPWLNLKTYSNQQGWTKIYYQVPVVAPAAPTRSLNDAYNQYLFWGAGKSKEILPTDIYAKLLQEPEFLEWTSKSGLFSGIEFDLSQGARKKFFEDTHVAYLGDAALQRKFTSVYGYFRDEIKALRNK